MAEPVPTNPARRPAVRTDDELRDLVRAAPNTPGRVGALHELVQRSPRGLTRTLTSLASDRELDTGMRLEAVAALGGIRGTPTPSALEALRSIVDDRDEDVAVVRRAIERLGKVGAADDLPRLRASRPEDPTTARTVRAAQCFLSYRHRLGEYRFDEPKRRLPASEDAAPLTSGAPTKRLRERFELRPAAVPGVGMAAQPLRRIECGSKEMAVVLNDTLAGADERAMASLADRQAVAAVITAYNIETGADEPQYYLLTDPTGGGAFRILGVRSSGKPGLVGRGTVRDGAVTFEVNASDQPLDHPMTVRGSYSPSGGTLAFDVALVDGTFSDAQQRRRRALRPDPD